jgi:hypothetical protein
MQPSAGQTQLAAIRGFVARVPKTDAYELANSRFALNLRWAEDIVSLVGTLLTGPHEKPA